MSYCAATLEACPTLQAQITDSFNTCNSGLHLEEIPLAEYIASGANRSNLTQLISPPNAKIRSVDLIYDQLILEAAVNTSNSEFCSATTKRGNCSQNYTIDASLNYSIEQLIDESDIRYACLENGEFLSKQILKMMLALEHKIATIWTTQAVALAGAWNTADIPETVNIGGHLEIPISLKDGHINPVASQILSNDITANGYCSTPFIAAGTDLYRYMQAAQKGCCTNQGLDVAAIQAQWGMAVAYDRRVKNAMGGNQYGLIVQPNSVIPLYWVKHPWKDGMAIPSGGGSNYVNYGLMLPRLAIPVDVYFVDKCPGAFHITISTVTKVVGLPQDLFPTGYHLDGVTFVNKIEATKCVDLCP